MNLLNRLEQSASMQIIVLLGIGALLYGQSLGFGYVWDDGLIFLDKNTLMVEPLSWKLVSAPFLEKMSYMRPLVMLSWWAEFHLFGQNPMVSHAINVAIYLGNVLLVRALALQLLRVQEHERPSLWASLAALLYAVHPALIESTAWVSGRFDLLCTFGLLAASVIFLRVDVRAIVRLPALLFFVAVALMSKELGVIAPGILICCWMAANGCASQSLKKNISAMLYSQRHVWAGLALLLSAYFITRKMSMGDIYGTPWGVEYLVILADTLLPLKALVAYGALVVLPFGRIGIMHPLTDFPSDALFWLQACLSVIALLVTIYQALMRQRSWAWMILAGYISIALVLHFIPMTINVNIAQDRFLTAPLAFCCIGFVLFIRDANIKKGVANRLRALRPAMKIVLACWILAAMFTVTSLAPLWKDPFMLWSWAHRQHSDVGIVVHNYLEASISSGRTTAAEAEFERLRKKKGGLDVEEQILYGNLLLRSANSEALNYLEGVLYALPRFHEMPNGKSLVDEHMLSSYQFASAYSDYALAKLLFEHDPASAMHYNQIARWYLNVGAHLFLDYFDAAFLYCSGEIDEADTLMRRIDPVYHYGRESMKQQTYSIVRAYCNGAKTPEGLEPTACLQLEARGFFEKNGG